MNILFLTFFSLTSSFLISKNLQCPSSDFLKKTNICNKFNKILSIDHCDSIILDGDKTELKKDYCKMLSDINLFNFHDCTYENFIVNLPYNEKNNTMIYVNNFLQDNGRIFNEYEQKILYNIPSTNNLIIFETENLDSVPLKDIQMIKRFKILNFPKITKRDIRCYIYDTINKNKYDDEMYLLNWTEYNDIDKLNFEKLNILLFEIDSMLKKKIGLNIIHLRINNLIMSLSSI